MSKRVLLSSSGWFKSWHAAYVHVQYRGKEGGSKTEEKEKSEKWKETKRASRKTTHTARKKTRRRKTSRGSATEATRNRARRGSTYFLIKTFTASQKLSAYLQHKTKFGKVVLIHLICPTLITDSIFLIQNHLCVVYYTNNNTSTPEVLLNSFQFINDFSFRLNSRIHLVYTLFDTAYFSFGKP